MNDFIYILKLIISNLNMYQNNVYIYYSKELHNINRYIL